MLETLLKDDDTDERCGLILQDGSIVEVANVAPNPAEAYEMDPAAVLPHIKAGTVVGTWHTHPTTDPTLSGADDDGFRAWPEWSHNVIGRRDGKVVVTRYRVEDDLVIVCS